MNSTSPQFLAVCLFLLLWIGSFLIGHFYSRAILLGLACARDLNHRMTPQDPWFFFNREFVPRAKRFVFVVLAFLFCSILLNAYVLSEVYGISGFGKILAAPVNHGGLILMVLAGITWWAPRTLNAPLLTFTGCLYGIGILMLKETLAREDPGSWVLLVPIVGLASFVSTWLYIRHKLNRAWFRFDD